ncbi:hypothetical protein D5Q60_27425 [Escherichia coli]|nr:hypothetical protein [Escherichia coli]RFQ10080.1 hypothetical protein CRD88_25770 [Escherichia coli]
MPPPVSIPVYLKRQCLSTNFKNTQDKIVNYIIYNTLLIRGYMNSILIITSLLIIFSIFSHALIKLGIGISNNPDKTDV